MFGGLAACLCARMHSTIAAREGTFPGMRVFVPFALFLMIAAGPALAGDGLPLPAPSGGTATDLTSFSIRNYPKCPRPSVDVICARLI